MAFTDLELELVERVVGGFCAKRNRPEYADQLNYSYEVGGQSITLYENRVGWKDPNEWTHSPIVKITHIKNTNTWKLYWMRATGKWQLYKPAAVVTDLDGLLRSVNQDYLGCFFG